MLSVIVVMGVVLPRVTGGIAAAIAGGLFVLLFMAEYVLITNRYLWVPLVLPMATLALGYIGLVTKRYLVTEAGKIKSDEQSAESFRQLGLANQGQGRLDEAFDFFRRVPLNDMVMDNLMNLALDFERKRQFNKAQAVYEHMANHDKNYKDLANKLKRAKNLSETVMLGAGATSSTLIMDGEVEKPTLGRYQLEKELGKGAMGVVYLGKDPKINRTVAIKTMALSQEFEGDDLVEARERFFREAETAGRLQHTNIVTIFDAGEEHNLAYIAMEFLRGKDLLEFTKPNHLLPIPLVVSICARVADALAYAHSLGVVHRDIKPANIMYERQGDVVKVTDFGIARVTDSSKTKTGMVLGTPSFMSAEQISGKRVDGRSDLYSLGVMLFQLLTGHLPFRGDSMAELMYKIANEPAPDVRSIRPEVPAALAQVVARALIKQEHLRYQTGTVMAQELRQSTNPSFKAGSSQSNAPSAPATLSSPSSTGLEAPVAQETRAFDATVPEKYDTTIVSHQRTTITDAAGTAQSTVVLRSTSDN
jgi:serine/threonine-protein kinase